MMRKGIGGFVSPFPPKPDLIFTGFLPESEGSLFEVRNLHGVIGEIFLFLVIFLAKVVLNFSCGFLERSVDLLDYLHDEIVADLLIELFNLGVFALIKSFIFLANFQQG